MNDLGHVNRSVSGCADNVPMAWVGTISLPRLVMTFVSIFLITVGSRKDALIGRLVERPASADIKGVMSALQIPHSGKDRVDVRSEISRGVGLRPGCTVLAGE
jgi:hypothetical protein